MVRLRQYVAESCILGQDFESTGTFDGNEVKIEK